MKAQIQTLASVSRHDISLVGGKAASLGEMLQAKLSVPSGFVITIKAFQQRDISDMLAQEILKAFDALGAVRVAVRSSAIGEDSESMSWAGQLETYLNVTRTGLIEAVQKCQASTESAHAKEYAKHAGLGKTAGTVAVVVQTMVDSEVSGVLFTANPVTGKRDEIVIEVVYGLGEMMVQGLVTPDNFIVRKTDGAMLMQTPGRQQTMLVYRAGQNRQVAVPMKQQKGPVLDAKQIKALVQTAKKIERHYGQPQDIEWAMAGNQLFIVQSRPITALRRPKASRLSPLPRQPKSPAGVKYALTVPQSVLFADLTLQAHNRPTMKVALGMDYAPAYVAIDAGGAMSWNYDADEAFEAALIGDQAVDDALSGFVDCMAATARKLERRSSLASPLVRQPDNPDDLLEDLQEYWQAYKLHMTTLFSFWNVEALLARTLTQALRQAGHETAIQGLEQFIKSNETNQFIRERVCFEKLVRRFVGGQRPPTARTASPQLLAALQHHAREFGFLLTPYNLGQAPSGVSLLSRVNEVQQRLQSKRETTVEAIKIDPGVSLSPRLRRLVHILEQLTFWKTERVDVISMADAKMELLYQATAKKLGLPPQELFNMTSSEIENSLKQGRLVVSREVLAERAVAYCLILYRGKVAFYQPSKPDTAGLLSRSPQSGFLQGVGSSPGVVQGSVRLLLDLKDVPQLQASEVLVTTMTRPEMGAALDRAAAFVTDEGGLLCHAAIISREMNKPCVIATARASKILRTGDLVEVDGSQGRVTILKTAHETND